MIQVINSPKTDSVIQDIYRITPKINGLKTELLHKFLDRQTILVPHENIYHVHVHVIFGALFIYKYIHIYICI